MGCWLFDESLRIQHRIRLGRYSVVGKALSKTPAVPFTMQPRRVVDSCRAIARADRGSSDQRAELCDKLRTMALAYLAYLAV